MNLQNFDLNIVCKKCRCTQAAIEVTQFYDIILSCKNCGNTEMIK